MCSVNPLLLARRSPWRRPLFVEKRRAIHAISASGFPVAVDVINTKTGKIEKVLKTRDLEIGAGEQKTLRFTDPWPNPQLWWPDEPNLYTLRTTV